MKNSKLLKSILAVIVAGAMTLSFVACGGSDEPEVTTAATTTAAPEGDTTTTAADGDTTTAEPEGDTTTAAPAEGSGDGETTTRAERTAREPRQPREERAARSPEAEPVEPAPVPSEQIFIILIEEADDGVDYDEIFLEAMDDFIDDFEALVDFVWYLVEWSDDLLENDGDLEDWEDWAEVFDIVQEAVVESYMELYDALDYIPDEFYDAFNLLLDAVEAVYEAMDAMLDAVEAIFDDDYEEFEAAVADFIDYMDAAEILWSAAVYG